MLTWAATALIPNAREKCSDPAVILAGVSGGWFGDYLRDPDGALERLVGHLWDWALGWGPVLVPVLAAAAMVEVLVRWWWARRCHDRLVADARQVTVLAPPTVDPAGGEALWSNLVGLLRPGVAPGVHRAAAPGV